LGRAARRSGVGCAGDELAQAAIAASVERSPRPNQSAAVIPWLFSPHLQPALDQAAAGACSFIARVAASLPAKSNPSNRVFAGATGAGHFAWAGLLVYFGRAGPVPVHFARATPPLGHFSRPLLGHFARAGPLHAHVHVRCGKGSRGSDPRLLRPNNGLATRQRIGERPRASRIVRALGLDQPYYIIPSLNKTANCTRRGDILSISATSSTCDRAANRSMQPKNRRVYAADHFPSAYIAQGKTPAPEATTLKRRTQPQPEEDLGGADICSLQEQPSTDNDQPLD